MNDPACRSLADDGAGLDQHADRRRRCSRLPPTSAPSGPCGARVRVTSAPRASSALTAAALPVRAAVISAVSPSGSAALASAPAASSRSIIAALPLVARERAAASRRSDSRRLARRHPTSSSALDRRHIVTLAPPSAAPSCRRVGVVRSPIRRSSVRTAATSPRFTASAACRRVAALSASVSSSTVPPRRLPASVPVCSAQTPESGSTADVPCCPPSFSAAHAHLVEHRQQEIRHRRLPPEDQVPAALDRPGAAADHAPAADRSGRAGSGC